MSRPWRRVISTVIFSICCGTAELLAQPKSTFRAESELVIAYTTVLDREYKFVKNLHAADFRLKIDKSDTPIEAFWKEDQAVSAVVVLDVSGSMKSELRSGRVLLRSLFQNALPQDEYALLLCADPIELAVPFSSDVDAILSWTAPLRAHGSTPLFDSVDRAVQLARQGAKPRKVVIVISDGEDTSSRLRLRELNRRVAEADVHLYVVQFWDGSFYEDRFGLRATAESTGGVFFPDVTRKDFREMLERLDVHQQYVIAFRPKGRAHDRKFHSIQIRVPSEVVPAARLFSRSGYYGNER